MNLSTKTTVIIAFISTFLFTSKTVNAQENIRKYEFTYAVNIPKSDSKVEIWIPLPQTDKFQTVNSINIDCPINYEIKLENKYNNKYLYISSDKVVSDNLKAKVSIKINRKERIGAVADNSHLSTSKFLEANKLVPITADVKKEAQEITKNINTTEDKAKSIYNHVIKTVKYDKSGIGWGNGDVIYVCDERRGNCTDFHSLFIAMCRSLDIPARFSIGFPIPSNVKEGEIKGYHCWAEFYIEDKGWVPVDASEAFKHPEQKEYLFGNLDYNRIEFTKGRDILLPESKDLMPLNFFIYPVCINNGKKYSLTKKFNFREL